MFTHNFKYTFKILIKNRTLVFWSILWPLILGCLFYMAFSNMSNSEKLDIINLGIVDNDAYKERTYLKETFKSLSDKKSDSYMFDIKYSTKNKLNKLLDDKKIDGYVSVDNNKVNIIVKESEINQTVIKSVVDEVEEYQNLTKNLTEYQTKEKIMLGEVPNVEQIYTDTITKLSSNKEYLIDASSSNMDFMMIEYYTLIAMACLYGALLSSEAIKNCLGNINRKGSRVNLAPVKRFTLILSSFCASLIIQLVSIAFLLLFTKYVFNVDFGNRTVLVILLSLVGSLAGLSLGILVGSLPFKNDGTRVGITNIVVMLGCFFSGMMGVTMKYIIDSNVPIINKINPANMITDGFYSLYYYSDLTRFYFNIISLLIVTIVFLLISCYYLRRKKYDSI